MHFSLSISVSAHYKHIAEGGRNSECWSHGLQVFQQWEGKGRKCWESISANFPLKNLNSNTLHYLKIISLLRTPFGPHLDLTSQVLITLALPREESIQLPLPPQLYYKTSSMGSSEKHHSYSWISLHTFHFHGFDVPTSGNKTTIHLFAQARDLETFFGFPLSFHYLYIQSISNPAPLYTSPCSTPTSFLTCAAVIVPTSTLPLYNPFPGYYQDKFF